MSLPDSRPERAQFQWRSELTRWGFLALIAIWIFHPFATSRFYGTGDALWYSNMLADFVLQWRAGIFPVFVGQTEYAFNGAVYPLRVAPLYQHVGGVLDLLTFHHLTFFELQHAIVIVMGVLGIVSCYTCLVSIVPRQRWTAALLTTLYITCPGVLGLIFIQDLYMSWMTVPFLPLAVYGIVRSYEKDDSAAWLAIAVGLGACWLGHAPIAMWITLITGVAQIIRLLTIHRRQESWKRAAYGSALLLAVAQYPFVSVGTLHVPDSPGATSGSLEHPERIVQALRGAFPGSLHPLSSGAGELSDLQLGYGLFGALLLAGLGLAQKRTLSSAILLAGAICVLLVLTPIAHWTEFFWLKLAPEQVRVLTFYWPMHRLYIVLAILSAFTLAAALAESDRRSAFTRGVVVVLSLGCIWSVWESRRFKEAAHLRTATALDTERKGRPENRMLMNHSYGLFAKLPPTFSHGVVDPNEQFRLLDVATGRPLPDASSDRIEGSGALRVADGPNPGVWELSPTFNLMPGQRYELKFIFSDPVRQGVLQISGTSFFREYMIPQSGEPLAFGSGSGRNHSLSLWTTRDSPETVSLRFIPTGDTSASLEHFADYQFGAKAEIVSGNVERWIPLSVRVRHPQGAALLETPRMFIDGYKATVNGQPTTVQPSLSGQVAVPIPPGECQVELAYKGSALLFLSFTLSALAGLAALVALIYLPWYHAQAPGS